jgi:hypothetical protein
VIRGYSLNKRIRDDSFWRILVLFSIIEHIIGPITECAGDLTCSVCGKIDNYRHNNMKQREWIAQRLLEIINDQTIVDEYFSVIWEVRKGIRHNTVHNASFPKSNYIEQEVGEILWDWTRTTEEWSKDSVALLSLENHIREIARNLLLNRLFVLNYFPTVPPLHSVRMVSK